MQQSIVTCDSRVFPALAPSEVFSRACHQLHVFPRLAPVTCFLALVTGYMISPAWRNWHQLHFSTRLATVTSFPALGTDDNMFPRALHGLVWASYGITGWFTWLHVFARLAPVGYMLSRAWEWLIACFRALGIGWLHVFARFTLGG